MEERMKIKPKDEKYKNRSAMATPIVKMKLLNKAMVIINKNIP
jgi:hypothetical protein